MFTGIVEQIGHIKNIAGSTFTIGHPFTEPFTLGESIALNGACMTVTSILDETFTVDIIKESRNRTGFDTAQKNDPLNLERSAIIGQRNSGHNVAGHVDETGEILSISEPSDFWLVRIKIRPENRKYIIEKGSIAVDGVSLTVSNLSPRSQDAGLDHWFEVSIIPHTWTHTIFHAKKTGDGVNLEYDQAGKYILNAQEYS